MKKKLSTVVSRRPWHQVVLALGKLDQAGPIKMYPAIADIFEMTFVIDLAS